MVATVIELGDPTGYTCRRGNLVNPRSSRSTVVVHLIVELDGSDASGRSGTCLFFGEVLGVLRS